MRHYKYRTIYVVEAFENPDLCLSSRDALIYRDFFRNKKLAEKQTRGLKKRHPRAEIYMRLLAKCEYQYVSSVIEQ